MTTLESVSRQLITKMGQSVSISSETVTVNQSSDWEDETYTETTATAKAIVSRPRQGNRVGGEAESGVEVDRVIYFRDDITDSITIYDGTGDATPTRVTIDGVEFTVVYFEDRGNGVVRCEVTRG